MHVGIQLHAPHGFQCLKRNTVYHFLKSDAPRNRVVLVTFGDPVQSTKADKQEGVVSNSKAELVYVQKDCFEGSLQRDIVVPCEVQRELPVKFGEVTSAELLEHESLRTKGGKKAHSQRIDDLLVHLWPAVQRFDEVLSADDPNAVLNQVARACTPKQNETRFRRAYFLYVAFGLNRWALHYSIGAIGGWDRSTKPRKYGRPSIEYGPMHGFSACNEGMKELMFKGFRDYADNGVHFAEIYRDTMRKVFGCKTATDSAGLKYFFHPEGKPFPTYRQFEYWVGKRIGLSERQVIKYGEARTRSSLRPSLGPFAQSVGNLMEIVEADAYQLKEVSKGYIEGSLLPKLWVVRIRCLTSGLLTGIGFSVGGERADAYRMAKACQALDKVWFCNLFAVKIRPEDWPSQGLSMHEVTDRGPGATQVAQARLPALWPVIKEGAPSYSGQSKATIETTNPKRVKLEGAPHHTVTSLTIPQLAVQEIRNLIKDNHTINVGARLSNKAVSEKVPPTPIHLWNDLAKAGRTHAVRVPQDMIIKGFFSQIDVTVEDGALYFHGQRYWSKAFADSGVFTSRRGLLNNQGKAYMLDVCVRHLFIETPAGMVTVDAMHGIRNGDEMLYLSEAELEQIALLRARGESTHRRHVHAAKAEQEQAFEDETGVPFGQFTRRRGRAKMKNPVSVAEAAAVTPVLRGKRSAR